jgi:hypothetical protein
MKELSTLLSGFDAESNFAVVGNDSTISYYKFQSADFSTFDEGPIERIG